MHHEAHLHSYSKTVFGFWLFLMSDCMLFGALFATYAVLQNNMGGLFNLPLALSQTLILLASSFASGPALLAAHRHKKAQVLFWFGFTFALGAVFLAMDVSEWMRLISTGNTWQKSGFLSSYFNLVGTHAVHVASGLLWIAFLAAEILYRGLTPVSIKRLTCLRLFWHFVNIVWVFIFTFVYLMGESGHV